MTKQVRGYQQRKAAGLCVRPGCKRIPPLGTDGTRRSYCLTHNAENRKNSDAWLARQKKAVKAKVTKKPRQPFTFKEVPTTTEVKKATA